MVDVYLLSFTEGFLVGVVGAGVLTILLALGLVVCKLLKEISK